MAIRTDLAREVHEAYLQNGHEPEGIVCEERQREGFGVYCVKVTDKRGEKAIGKAVGSYMTIELDSLLHREDDAFARGAQAIADELRPLLPQSGCVLVAGIGNRNITPDSIGPEVVRWTMATRHLVDGMKDMFGALRPVAAISAGVLGDTGMESAELINALCKKIKPACVIAVDALASRSVQRLCRTVQITDTGITPGSGVGNHRIGLNADSLGCPVVAVGVPTVVDARTLAADITATDEESIAEDSARGLIVTPREIDRQAADISRLVGYGINLALQPSLAVGDLDMLLG